MDTSADFLPKHLRPGGPVVLLQLPVHRQPLGIDECLTCGQLTTDTELSMCSNCVEWHMG